MQDLIDNSLVFGLYEEPQRKLVGLARCVTDFITFVYVTDVWVNPDYQGRGLGGWMIQSVRETIETMPHLRRSMLLTASWEKSVPFYEKLLDMSLVETKFGQGLAVMESKGRAHPTYGKPGTGYS